MLPYQRSWPPWGNGRQRVKKVASGRPFRLLNPKKNGVLRNGGMLVAMTSIPIGHLRNAPDKSVDLLMARMPFAWVIDASCDAIADEAAEFLAECARVTKRWAILSTHPMHFDIWHLHATKRNVRYIRAGIWMDTKISGAPASSNDLLPESGFDVLFIGYGVPTRSTWNGGGRAGTWMAPDDDRSRLAPMLIESCIDAFTNPNEVVAICDGSDPQLIHDLIVRSKRRPVQFVGEANIEDDSPTPVKKKMSVASRAIDLWETPPAGES